VQAGVSLLAAATLGALLIQEGSLKPLPVSGLGGRPRARAPQPAPPAGRPQLPPLPVTGLDEPTRAELDGGRTFSVRLAEPLGVRDLLLLLVRDTGFSVVVEPGADGLFVGELKDVTLRQALDLVVRPFGLEYAVQDHAIRVFRRQPETRFFDVNLAAERRSASRSVGASSRLGSGTEVGTQSTLAARHEGDAFDDIAAGVRTLLSADGRFNLDRKAGLLQATDFPERLDRVRLYLEAVQARLHREVEIQARVLEIELKPELASGIDWNAALQKVSSTRFGAAGSPAAGSTAVLRLLRADLETLLLALAEQGTVSTLAAPRVVTMNNEPALMRVGTDEVFFAAAANAAEPRAVSTGLTLAVVPQIAADGIVVLSLAPSLVSKTGDARSRDGERAPVVDVRAADTIVRVLEGETVVLSGMLRDREFTIVPEGLAGLFRRGEKRRAKTELVVLLTPTVVTPIAGMSR
jgi:type IVB pilus formation R64 PilN family outer membrane protein